MPNTNAHPCAGLLLHGSSAGRLIPELALPQGATAAAGMQSSSLAETLPQKLLQGPRATRTEVVQIGDKLSEAATGFVQRCNVAARISSEPLSDNLELMCLR
jgi:hypothetical protein